MEGELVAVGIVSTALVLPISLFILRYKPEEMGLLPYGAENVEQRAVSAHQRLHPWKTGPR